MTTAAEAAKFLTSDIRDVSHKPHLRPMVERALEQMDFSPEDIQAAVNELIPERVLQ
jgi:hypothetical protein